MKLATLKNEKRDGQLCVVNRELTQMIAVPQIAPTMQEAIENWETVSPQLDRIYQQLNRGELPEAECFDSTRLESPFPRAYQWADGSAYVNHVELVRKARGATMPENFWTDPLMYQGGSDNFIGPRDDILIADEAYGVDFEAEIAVVTDDVPMASSAEEAAKHIKLLMLVNDVSLRNLIPSEISKGFGFLHSKPASSFSPVAITPDELESAWEDSKVHLPLVSHLNDCLFGEPEAGQDMTFNFAELVAHAAKTRELSAGTIIGSGTISNTDRSKGSSCIAEKRMLETIANGSPSTAFMKYGDRIRIEMLNGNGESLFGSIDQVVRSYQK